MDGKQTWRGLLAAGLTMNLAAPAFSHGGGLNAEGCHNNRKTGDYHCHQSGSPPPPPPPAPSYFVPQSSVSDTDNKSERLGAYSNCTEARAAGAAPVYAGEDGYGRHLDRDGDGVGCE